MSKQTLTLLGVILAGVVVVAALAAYATTQVYTIQAENLIKLVESRVANPAAAAEGERVIYVNGVGVVYTTPDEAVVQVSVEVSNPSAAAAQDEASKRMASVIAAMKSLEVADEQMRTSGLSLFPIRDEKGLQIVGYVARNTLTVTVSDLSKVSEVIERAVAAGANTINSLTFQVSSEKARSLKSEAIKLAVQDAKLQAEAAAAAAGKKVIGLKSLTIGGIYLPTRTLVGAEAYAKEAYVMPGESQITVSVSATFLIE
jgi:uncharacterized protein YggE